MSARGGIEPLHVFVQTQQLLPNAKSAFAYFSALQRDRASVCCSDGSYDAVRVSSMGIGRTYSRERDATATA